MVGKNNYEKNMRAGPENEACLIKGGLQLHANCSPSLRLASRCPGAPHLGGHAATFTRITLRVRGHIVPFPIRKDWNAFRSGLTAAKSADPTELR
jgi:hypothetical protein